MAYSSGPYVVPRRVDIALSPTSPQHDRLRTPRTTSPYNRTSGAHSNPLQRSHQTFPSISETSATPHTDGNFTAYYRYSNHARGPSDESGYTSVSQLSQDDDKAVTFFSDAPEVTEGSKLTSATQPWITTPTSAHHPEPTFFTTPGPQEDVFELETEQSQGAMAVKQVNMTSSPVMPAHKRRSSLPLLSDDAHALSFGAQDMATVLARSAAGSVAKSNLLQVDIPHYRIGRPRYTDRGTVYLQSICTLSSLAPTSTKSSKTTSRIHDSDFGFPSPPADTKRSMALVNPTINSFLAPIEEANIVPNIYNIFLSDPENPNFIIFTSSGQLLAATPARLIVHITHDQFLDYKLLSDFFLTFRSFMKPSKLLDFLIARLKWALFEPTHGRIVRVRAFVALRHWILNYFLDDFEPDFQLRTRFCDQINDLTSALCKRPDGGAGDLQVIGELKKAWRRTCDIVWDSGVGRATPSQAILPGGRALGRAVRPSFLTSPILEHSGSGKQPLGRNVRSSVLSMQDMASPRASMYALRGPTSPRSPTCSIPLWRRLVNSRKTTKAASIMCRRRSLRPIVASRSVRLGTHRPKRVSTHKRQTRSSHPAIKYLERYSNGELIRGTAIAPSLSPAAGKAMRPPSTAPDYFESAIVGHGRSVSALSNRSDRASRYQAWPAGPSRRFRTSKRAPGADQMTIKAAERFVELREESSSAMNPIIEVPTPPATSAGIPRKPQSTYLKTQSHVTTGSRSIVIMDDTHGPWQDDLGDSNKFTPWGEGQHDSPQTQDYFAFQDMVPTVASETAALKMPTSLLEDDSQTFSKAQDSVRRNSTGSTVVDQMNLFKQISIEQPLEGSRASFQHQVKLASIADETDEADDGGVESTLAKLEGTSTHSHTPPGSSHSSLKSRMLSGLSTQSALKGLNLLIPDASPMADDTAEFDFTSKDNVEVPFSPASAQSAALSDPHRVSGETLEASRYWPLGMSASSGTPVRASFVKSTKTSQPSSFLLAPDESLEILEEEDEVEDLTAPKANEGRKRASTAAPRHAKSTSVSSVAHSFFLEEDESDYEEDQTRDADQSAIVSPLTPLNRRQSFGRFAPPLSPPPASPLPMPPAGSHFTRLATPVGNTSEPVNMVQTLRRPTLQSSPLINVKSIGENKTNVAGHATHSRNVSEATMLTALTGSHVSRTYSAMSRHTPFILSYSADMLARHFTIIEQDALTEIHWDELINLKWAAVPVKVHDWATFLTEPNQTGVDMVIARFNLVVKWAISQVVMTTDTTERAKAITKFIEIASACKKIANYATCYQLTVAMLSPAIVRLTRTWSAVDATTCQTLANLERLVHARGDFGRLRTAMESRPQAGRGSTGDGHANACIPFVGIYTHDLSVNQHKPATFDPLDASGETMINFERFQTAARIVKRVLKLVEASAFYRYKVDRELVSKCLWLSALDDEEIARRSIALCFV